MDVAGTDFRSCLSRFRPNFHLLVAGFLFFHPLSYGEFALGKRISELSGHSDDLYLLVNQATGKTLSTVRGQSSGAAQVELTQLDDTVSQLWAFEDAGSGRFRIANASSKSGRLVDVPSIGKIFKKAEEGTGGKEWTLEKVKNGYFRVVNHRTERSLSADGKTVSCRHYTKESGQHWAIHRAVPTPERPDFRMMGWATAQGGTTGGKDGRVVKVSTPEDFEEYISKAEPLIILVEGTLDFRPVSSKPGNSGRYHISSDKTILGLGDDAQILGAELRLRRVRNVIIRNLKLSESPDTAIAISTGTTHVWIDHCTISGAPDGLIDITTGADFITVSWCHLKNADRMGLTGRVNNKETDKEAIRVTYHHNWFDNLRIRVPYGAWGKIHLFNNYYTNIHQYGIGIAAGVQIVSENSFWNGARRSFFVRDKDDGWKHDPGTITDVGSIFTNILIDDQVVPNIPIGWHPENEYAYTKNHTLNVPHLVKSGAGTGIIRPADAIKSP